MKKQLLFLMLLFVYAKVMSVTFIDMYKPPTQNEHYNVLIAAVIQVESKGQTHLVNEKEKAVGAFQIRPIRVKDYNICRKTSYKLNDFFDYELSREMFLFYARGKSFEKAAKDWNGSGAMTITYWNKVKLKLKSIMDKSYNPQSYDAYKLMHEGLLAFAKAEQQGFRVDLEYVIDKKQKITKKIERIERQFKESDLFSQWQKATKGAVNIHSTTQLAYYLYNVRKITPAKLTETGKGSTDDEALGQLGIPEINSLLEVRKLKKIRDTYLDAFEREQVNGVIHPFYNLHLVRTFRSSSDSPNWQNLPKRDKDAMRTIRSAIYARKGHQLLELDFSGMEVKIAACYHKDPNMMKYLNDPSSDMHADMAKQIFKIKKFDKSTSEHNTLRQAAKNGFVFPQFYGDYYKNCAVNMACTWGQLGSGKWKPGQGIPLNGKNLSDHMIANGFTSLDAFTDHVHIVERDFWGDRFAHYAWWKDTWWDMYRKYGYVEMLTGFRCYGVMSKNDAINYPVQGAAFHCMLWCFIQITHMLEEKNMDSKIIGQIHDSIIFDIHPDELHDVWTMAHKVCTVDLPKHWPWINVPLEVDGEISPVDGSWAEKEKFKV